MITVDIKERLLAANAAAAEQINFIRSGATKDYSVLFNHVRQYVMHKFLLTEADLCTDNLFELAEISIANSTNIRRQDLAELDVSLNCTGESSVITKKVLLLLALQKGLAIQFSPDETADIETLPQLAAVIFRDLKAARQPSSETAEAGG